MKIIKIILKKILPPFLLEFIIEVRNFLRNPFNRNSTINEFKPNKDKIVILGNGPSLKQSICNYKEFIKENDCIVVNSFSQTNYFSEIKPNIYLLMDPNFFAEIDSLSSYDRNEVINTLNCIKEKVSWNISFVLPFKDRNSFFVSELRKNRFVSFYYINTIPMIFCNSEEAKFKAWQKNLIIPPAQTVINTAVYLGLFWNYSETYIFGIDSDFFRDLHVDQETNILYVNENHFYGTGKHIVYKNSQETEAWTYPEFVTAYSKMFELYWDLKKFADYKGLKVYNASEFSMVDAFERKKPE